MSIVFGESTANWLLLLRTLVSGWRLGAPLVQRSQDCGHYPVNASLLLNTRHDCIRDPADERFLVWGRGRHSTVSLNDSRLRPLPHPGPPSPAAFFRSPRASRCSRTREPRG